MLVYSMTINSYNFLEVVKLNCDKLKLLALIVESEVFNQDVIVAVRDILGPIPRQDDDWTAWSFIPPPKGWCRPEVSFKGIWNWSADLEEKAIFFKRKKDLELTATMLSLKGYNVQVVKNGS